MITAKITMLIHFPIDFQEQFEHVKARGEPLSQYIRGCVLADRENELSTTVSENRVVVTRPTKDIYYILIQEAVKNNLPGFCGGFISSIMLKRSGLLNMLSLEEQKNILRELGYQLYKPVITNPVLPDYGCPRLYVHQDSGVSLSTDVCQVTKRYTLANHQAGTKLSTPHQMIRRIKTAIGDGRPGFCGGFLSIPHLQEFLKYDLLEKDVQQICVRLGYHQNSNNLLVKDCNPDESLEHYMRANTFVNHTEPMLPKEDESWVDK